MQNGGFSEKHTEGADVQENVPLPTIIAGACCRDESRFA